MRRRFSSVAIAIVAALAARAAYWPSLGGSRPGPWPHTLADLDLDAPAFVVLVVAAVDLLASFAPTDTLPRAVAGRREPAWVAAASRARELVESRIAVAMRRYAWLVCPVSFLVAMVALVGGGPGSRLAATSHLFLALLVAMRSPPLAYDVSSRSE